MADPDIIEPNFENVQHSSNTNEVHLMFNENETNVREH